MSRPPDSTSARRGRRAGPTRRGGQRAPLASAVGIVSIALLIGAALTIMLATRQRVAVPNFLILSMISLCFAGGYIGVYRLSFDRLLASSGTWWGRLLLHMAALVVATAIGGGVALSLTSLVGGPATPGQHLRLFGVGLAVLTAIRVLQLGYDGLRQQVRESELREERAHQQVLRAELAALQARTDPHFLFNGLNTVAGLIEENPERAVEVVTRLGNFFRHHLQASRAGTIALGDEVQAAATYLEIQALRFDDRLSWSVSVDPSLAAVQIPPLLLQPLVENSVVHGMSARGLRTHVVVSAERAGDQVRLTVEDDGPGPGGSTHHGVGTSLSDLTERLELIYGGKADIEAGRGPRNGFRVSIAMPLDGLGAAGEGP